MLLVPVPMISLWSCRSTNVTFWLWISSFLQVQFKRTAIWERLIYLLLVVFVVEWGSLPCSNIQWIALTNKETWFTWGSEWVSMSTVIWMLSTYLQGCISACTRQYLERQPLEGRFWSNSLCKLVGHDSYFKCKWETQLKPNDNSFFMISLLMSSFSKYLHGLQCTDNGFISLHAWYNRN